MEQKLLACHAENNIGLVLIELEDNYYHVLATDNAGYRHFDVKTTKLSGAWKLFNSYKDGMIKNA